MAQDRQERTLRTDAARNRERVLAAAREVFAERGLDVPMAEIADRAGVGVGTLYRRFAGRDEIVSAVFAADLRAYADTAEEALSDPDPWRALSGLLYRICEWQASDQGFSDVLLTPLPQAPEVDRQRDRFYFAILDLVQRARAAGELRDDVTADDGIVLLIANAALLAATRDVAPDAWRRPAKLMISAFRSTNTDPMPPAPGNEVVHEILRRLSSAR
ncbi:TetR/AcrR family transcriptional regulator [Jiangella anatolica]|uniref:TetR/AcrR family transcriptional regulator n=1 Tax=Jiangella anatolica TaxID=2670374 RepID=A0A2W2BQX1_9ACTN|nr:TetR/AcrR family transcriptional regulator [Jiangella anatolica]PZF82528.1 TetR/AcrR family transcriptional regulator [Jiangella anatolica]